MAFRAIPDSEAAPFIACVIAAGDAQHRLASLYPKPPMNLRGTRINPDPAKRRNDPQRTYGLTEAELPEWRWLMARKRLTALEAANVVLRSRRDAKP